jgi:chloride channel 3/4/5
MIRFNGYPFLEKEDKEDGDHAFIEPSKLSDCSRGTEDDGLRGSVGHVMKKDIIMMKASGMPLQEIGKS